MSKILCQQHLLPLGLRALSEYSATGKVRCQNIPERVLMQVRFLGPISIETEMATHSMCNCASQLHLVCMCNSRRVISTKTKSPCGNLLHIEELLFCHPLENTIPQPVRTFRVFGISWTVGRSRNLYDHCRPSSLQELVCPLGVVRAMSIQACY